MEKEIFYTIPYYPPWCDGKRNFYTILYTPWCAGKRICYTIPKRPCCDGKTEFFLHHTKSPPWCCLSITSPLYIHLDHFKTVGKQQSNFAYKQFFERLLTKILIMLVILAAMVQKNPNDFLLITQPRVIETSRKYQDMYNFLPAFQRYNIQFCRRKYPIYETRRNIVF